MSELIIRDSRFERGKKGFVSVPVTQDLTMPISIDAHVVSGIEPGPTLLLLSMLHGNEWFSVLVLRELVRRLDPQNMRGDVIAIPVANQAAFTTASRCVLDDSDEPDGNRTFGGEYEWLTNQISRVLQDEFFSRCSHLIDYHVSDWGSAMADISHVVDYKDDRLNRESRQMALAYGFPVLHALQIHSGLRGPRTSLGYAGEHYGIPGIVAGVGGLGFGQEQESRWLETNVRGSWGVLQQLGMVEGEPRRCERILSVSDYWRVSPRTGGYLEPVIGLDRQFGTIGAGELLGRVVSPTSFDTLDELRSPGEGTLFYSCRAHMVRPGSWAFGVAKGDDSEWQKVEQA